MIKINLLPPNIYEKRQIRQLIGLFVVGAILIGGGIGYWDHTIKVATQTTMEQADAAENLTKQAEGFKAKAAETRKPIDDEINPKIKFFDSVAEYNNEYPKLFEEVAKFTKSGIVYTSLDPTGGTTLTISASATKLMDIGFYLSNMYRATHIFTSVAITTPVGGWPSGASGSSVLSTIGSMASTPMPGGYMPGMPGGPRMTTYGGMDAIGVSAVKSALSKAPIQFTVSCTLAKAITAPTPPAGGAAGAAPGAAGPMTGPMTAPPPAAATPAPSTTSETGGSKSAGGEV